MQQMESLCLTWPQLFRTHFAEVIAVTFKTCCEELHKYAITSSALLFFFFLLDWRRKKKDPKILI